MPGGGYGEESLRKATVSSAAGGTAGRCTHMHALLLAHGQVSTGVGQLSPVTMQAAEHIVVLPFLAVESQPFLSGEPGTAM